MSLVKSARNWRHWSADGVLRDLTGRLCTGHSSRIEDLDDGDAGGDDGGADCCCSGC